MRFHLLLSKLPLSLYSPSLLFDSSEIYPLIGQYSANGVKCQISPDRQNYIFRTETPIMTSLFFFPISDLSCVSAKGNRLYGAAAVSYRIFHQENLYPEAERKALLWREEGMCQTFSVFLLFLLKGGLFMARSSRLESGFIL